MKNKDRILELERQVEGLYRADIKLRKVNGFLLDKTVLDESEKKIIKDLMFEY